MPRPRGFESRSFDIQSRLAARERTFLHTTQPAPARKFCGRRLQDRTDCMQREPPLSQQGAASVIFARPTAATSAVKDEWRPGRFSDRPTWAEDAEAFVLMGIPVRLQLAPKNAVFKTPGVPAVRSRHIPAARRAYSNKPHQRVSHLAVPPGNGRSPQNLFE